MTSIGSSAFYGCSGLTGITIPDSVTSIGNYAFRGCTGLTDITIPNSVTSIGNSVFKDCTGIHVTIPGSIIVNTSTSSDTSVFSGCANLFVTISDGSTVINDKSFYNCTGLTNITIPDSVTSIGVYAFYGCTGLTDITIPTSVTSIGRSAFYGCTELTDITIPDSVTSIGSSAFSGCTGLTSITIPDGVTSIGYSAFSGCTGLTDITIPDSVTSIGSSAFSGCTGLTSITIPDGVTSIGYGAFEGCTGLTGITIPNSVTSIGNAAFSGCTGLTGITIPNSVTSIGDEAFYGCTGLTGITIPNSVTYIGSSAFINCTRLTEITVSPENTEYVSLDGVLFNKRLWEIKSFPAGKSGIYTIPDSVTSIGSSAFDGCTGLTNITIPNSVTNVGDHAFYGCTGLTNITIPNSVTNVGDYAFYGCTGLTGITIPDSVTSIGWSTFNGCTGLTDITIPDSVTSIGDEAFYGCTGLTGITIPNSVTSIGYGAFNGCTGLTDITIPDSVTSIGWRAFAGCTGLTDITIPDSVTSIGQSAFSGCTGLTDITIPDSVTRIDEYAFSGCTNLVIHGITGSYAQTYAINKNIPFVPLSIIGISITHQPNQTVYPINGTLRTGGLIVIGTTEDNETVGITLDCTFTYDFSTGGEKTVTVKYGDLSTSFVVTVDPDFVAYPESAHPYANNTNQTWSYTHRTSADSLKVTFSGGTKTENDYDYIYLYNGSGEQIGKYSGTSLAGQTIEIPGNSFSIKLTSDSSYTYYGFAITSIEAINSCTHTYGEWETVTVASCTTDGQEKRVCSLCQHEETRTVPALGHNYTSVVTAPTATEQGYTTYTCTRCSDSYIANYTDPTGPIAPTPTKVQFGKSIRLGATVNLNIIVNGASIPASATDIKATLWHLDENGDKADIVVEDITSGEVAMLSYDKLPAYALTTTVYAQVSYTNNGVDYISQKFSTSTAAYCAAQLRKTTISSSLRTLMVDLLNYGSAAQVSYNVDVTNLANKDIDAYQSAASQANPEMTDVAVSTGTGVSIGVALSLKNRVEMKYFVSKTQLADAGITIDADHSYLRVTRSDNGEYQDLPIFGEDDTTYIFYYAGLSIFEFDVSVDAELFVNDSKVSKTRTYSVNTCLVRNVTNEDTKLANLCTMLSRYGASAKAYVANPNG